MRITRRQLRRIIKEEINRTKRRRRPTSRRRRRLRERAGPGEVTWGLVVPGRLLADLSSAAGREGLRVSEETGSWEDTDATLEDLQGEWGMPGETDWVQVTMVGDAGIGEGFLNDWFDSVGGVAGSYGIAQSYW